MDNLAREIVAPERSHLKLVGSSVQPKIWERIPLEIQAGGITLHIDVAEEVLYMDCAPGYSYEAYTVLVGALPSYGFELLSEYECPSEMLDDGTIRIWMCEVGA